MKCFKDEETKCLTVEELRCFDNTFDFWRYQAAVRFGVTLTPGLLQHDPNKLVFLQTNDFSANCSPRLLNKLIFQPPFNFKLI
jgi:hypothetical protein